MSGVVPDPAPEYRAFDLFWLSSDTEQMPLSLLEAMASGLPVVATDVGDVARIVAPENRRFVVPAGDADALARAFDELAADAGLRAELGSANRERVVQEFEIGECYGRYVELYLETVRG